MNDVLPTRRRAETMLIDWLDPSGNVLRLHVCVGFVPGEPAREVFASLGKPNSLLALLLSRECIFVSHMLQTGLPAAGLRALLPDAGSAVTPLDAVLDALVAFEAGRGGA